MNTHFSVLIFIVSLGLAKGNPIDCVSREEFEKFKTEVLSQIEKLTEEKNEQAKQIEEQKKAILDLKTLLIKYGDTLSIRPHPEESLTNSTETVPVEVMDGRQDYSEAQPSPLKRLPSRSTSISVIEDVIAFYVYLTILEVNPGRHHVIIYDNVVTNAGNGYNKYTGIFHAPREGFYVFTWTTFVSPNSYFPIELTVNGYRRGITSADGGTTIYNGVTGVAVVHLQENDDVVVRSDATTIPHGHIFSDQNMKTSFSGWCISC